MARPTKHGEPMTQLERDRQWQSGKHHAGAWITGDLEKQLQRIMESKGLTRADAVRYAIQFAAESL